MLRSGKWVSGECLYGIYLALTPYWIPSHCFLAALYDEPSPPHMSAAMTFCPSLWGQATITEPLKPGIKKYPLS